LSFEDIYFRILKWWKTLVPGEKAALQPRLGTGSVPVSSGLRADLRGHIPSYHLNLQWTVVRKDLGNFEYKGKWWRHSSTLL